MQTDVSNILSDLITLSDNADQIILDSNFGNDQVGQWFSIIKETANALVKGTYCRSSPSPEKSSFSKNDLPSLVTLIKGKQNTHRVSALLAEVQKDKRARLSHRKSRKSLRKIILGKKSGNQWKISTRKSSVKNSESNEDEDKSTTPIPKVKDRLLESQIRSTLDISTNRSLHSKSYFSELDSSSKKTPQNNCSTPVQSKEILVLNINETTPVTRSKSKPVVESTKVVKVEKTSIPISSQNSLLSETKAVKYVRFSSESKEASSQFIESNSVDPKESSDSQADVFLTPGNETITIDSDHSADKNGYTTPLTRSKRKSSVQHNQKDAKRIKSTTSSQILPGKSNNSKWNDNLTGNNAFKQIKLVKEINSVIPIKNLHQQIQTHPEKRVLREIQKKEEKVSQNARKLRSLQKIKIEENKKVREKKMEKAMQQRMKLEKEKEERIRSRTQSKQENLQTEAAPKNGSQKKVDFTPVVKNPSKSQHEDKCDPPRKPLRSPVKKVRISPVEQKSPKSTKNVMEVNKAYFHNPTPKEISNTNLLNNLNATYVRSPANVENYSSPSITNEKAPLKPIRNVKKANETSGEKNAYEIKEIASNKPGPSTPATKKGESKFNLAKTPVLNNSNKRKPNSYVMTPHENSFISYDISEIKSDSDDDEEDESSQKKPIPTWASGINLRTALLKQHYAPINVGEIFGNHFEPPYLSKIMGAEKRHYYKRTSSAIWLESPNRSRSYQT